MGLNSTPAYARVLTHPEIVLRNVHRGMFGSRSGALRYGDFAVSPTGVTRQFSVAPGRAYIHGRENSSQGGYVTFSDAAENLVVPAPAASPRIDTLLLRVYDEQYGTLPSGTSRAQWDIVPGVAAASPNARPDTDFLLGGSQYVPGAWWRVADIRSNPGDTTIPSGQFYPTLDHARVPGADTLCLSAPTVTGFGGRPTDQVLNDTIREVDTGVRRRWNGSAWVMIEPYRIEVPVTVDVANVNIPNIPAWLRRLAVTFSARSSSASTTALYLRTNGITTNSYQFLVRQTNNVTQNIVNFAAANSAQVGAVNGTDGVGFTTGGVEIYGWNLTSGQTDKFTYYGHSATYGTQAGSYLVEAAGSALTPQPWTSLAFSAGAGNIVVGSHFMLEGWD